MSSYVLVPGAGGDATYWNRVVPLLRERGHDAVPVDIPEDDPSLGLPEYARLVLDAMGDRQDVVLVGQSLGAFTVPMVAEQRVPRAIVLMNAMIPVPGETPGEWWDSVGQADARAESDHRAGRDGTFDVETYFLHDLSDEVKAGLYGSARAPSDTPFGQPCTFTAWADVPIRVLTGADDRFFPADFQRRVARERLGIEPDVRPGGHLIALANPRDVADYLLALA